MVTREKIIKLINNVDWSKYTVVNGESARNVPIALIKLMSDSREVHDDGLDNLDNVVIVQRNLYEAAYYIIPFLFLMLECKELHWKDGIYLILEEISFGSNGNTEKGVSINIEELGILSLEELEFRIPNSRDEPDHTVTVR